MPSGVPSRQKEKGFFTQKPQFHILIIILSSFPSYSVFILEIKYLKE